MGNEEGTGLEWATFEPDLAVAMVCLPQRGHV